MLVAFSSFFKKTKKIKKNKKTKNPGSHSMACPSIPHNVICPTPDAYGSYSSIKTHRSQINADCQLYVIFPGLHLFLLHENLSWFLKPLIIRFPLLIIVPLIIFLCFAFWLCLRWAWILFPQLSGYYSTTRWGVSFINRQTVIRYSFLTKIRL